MCAGMMLTVPAGCWYTFEVVLPVIMATRVWLTVDGGVKALYGMTKMHYAAWRENNARAQALIPKKISMPPVWKRYLHYAVRLYAPDVQPAFTFHAVGEPYRLKTDYAKTGEEEEIKGRVVFMLAALARDMSAYKGAGKFRVKNLQARHLGRLTNWCAANMGISTTQRERSDRLGPNTRQGRKRSRGQAGTSAAAGNERREGSDTESE
jgi:hypothetical protein